MINLLKKFSRTFLLGLSALLLFFLVGMAWSPIERLIISLHLDQPDNWTSWLNLIEPYSFQIILRILVVLLCMWVVGVITLLNISLFGFLYTINLRLKNAFQEDVNG